jgi:hypothetical protein
MVPQRVRGRYGVGYDFGWLVGLALCGVHLMVLGLLIARPPGLPSIMGYVLLIAGAAYLIDTAAHAPVPSYSDYETVFTAVVAVPSVVGGLWLAVWLLARGARLPEHGMLGTRARVRPGVDVANPSIHSARR